MMKKTMIKKAMLKKTKKTIKKIKKIRRRKKLKKVAKRLLIAGIVLMLVNDAIQIAIAYRDYRRNLRKKAEEHLAKGSDET